MCRELNCRNDGFSKEFDRVDVEFNSDKADGLRDEKGYWLVMKREGGQVVVVCKADDDDGGRRWVQASLKV